MGRRCRSSCSVAFLHHGVLPPTSTAAWEASPVGDAYNNKYERRVDKVSKDPRAKRWRDKRMRKKCNIETSQARKASKRCYGAIMLQ
jgi:hypothetical protein